MTITRPSLGFSIENPATFDSQTITPAHARERLRFLTAAKRAGALTPRSESERGQLVRLFGPDAGPINNQTVMRDPDEPAWYKVHDPSILRPLSLGDHFRGTSAQIVAMETSIVPGSECAILQAIVNPVAAMAWYCSSVEMQTLSVMRDGFYVATKGSYRSNLNLSLASLHLGKCGLTKEFESVNAIRSKVRELYTEQLTFNTRCATELLATARSQQMSLSSFHAKVADHVSHFGIDSLPPEDFAACEEMVKQNHARSLTLYQTIDRAASAFLEKIETVQQNINRCVESISASQEAAGVARAALTKLRADKADLEKRKGEYEAAYQTAYQAAAAEAGSKKVVKRERGFLAFSWYSEDLTSSDFHSVELFQQYRRLVAEAQAIDARIQAGERELSQALRRALPRISGTEYELEKATDMLVKAATAIAEVRDSIVLRQKQIQRQITVLQSALGGTGSTEARPTDARALLRSMAETCQTLVSMHTFWLEYHRQSRVIEKVVERESHLSIGLGNGTLDPKTVEEELISMHSDGVLPRSIGYVTDQVLLEGFSARPASAAAARRDV